MELFTPVDPRSYEQMKWDGVRIELYPPKRKAEMYDLVYSSKIFDYTPENPHLPPDTIKGGTGYNVNTILPPEIESVFPDYSIYPECDYAIGFITRGCPNSCSWCVVPAKEGGIKPYRDWRELVRPDSKKLVLMDNNILACEHGISQLESLIDSGYSIDLNQGMDARLVDGRVGAIIARLKWIEYIRFSCDSPEQIEPIRAAASLLARHGVKPYRIFVYMLVTKDIDCAATRVEGLKRIENISIYAQPERDKSRGIKPTAEQMKFCQRYIYGGSFRKETWQEYCCRTDSRPRSNKKNKAPDANKKYRHFNFNDRLLIESMLVSGKSPQEIVGRMEFSKTSIYREIKRGGYDLTKGSEFFGKTVEGRYSALVAESRYRENLIGKKASLKLKIHRLKMYRLNCGLNQKELAEKVGISLSSMGKYERGESSPPIDVFKNLAKTLSVPLGELIGH